MSKRMMGISALGILLPLLVCSVDAAAARRSHGHAGHRHGKSTHSRRSRRGSKHVRSRTETDSARSSPRPSSATIPPERVAEIQKALIKSGYMSGEPSGQYDDATMAAMKQFQASNGMPATGLPSATSLKRLGVAKASSDGYAVPIKSASGKELPSAPHPEAARPDH